MATDSTTQTFNSGTLPPTLPSLSYAELLSNLIQQWAAQTKVSPSLASGDPLLAEFQSIASQGVFIENVLALLSSLTRAQTSTGANLDTWMAQFGFPRLPATYANGPVTLSVLSAHNTDILIPLTTIEQTVGGAIQYQLIADTEQAAYVSGSQNYLLPAGETSISATAQALSPGSLYNVQANQLTQFLSPPPGIDQVTNPGPILNGEDAESDSSYLARFAAYIQSLSKATGPAITSAIDNLQQGITFKLYPNTNNAGQYQQGMFTVVVANSTSALITNISTMLESVAGLTIQYNVLPANVVSGSVSVSIAPTAGYALTDLELPVQRR